MVEEQGELPLPGPGDDPPADMSEMAQEEYRSWVNMMARARLSLEEGMDRVRHRMETERFFGRRFSSEVLTEAGRIQVEREMEREALR